MMKMAVRARGRSKIIAVTVLTSQRGSTSRFSQLVRDARVSGVQGIVCSAHELPVRNMMTVVPGIRPLGYKKDDQRRTATPREALDAGADYLVIGRPLTQKRDPVTALHDMMTP